MKRRFRVLSDDGEHLVEYRQNIFGVVRIIIDGDEFRLGYVSCFKRRTEPFMAGGSKCMLVIRWGGEVEITSPECRIEKL